MIGLRQRRFLDSLKIGNSEEEFVPSEQAGAMTVESLRTTPKGYFTTSTRFGVHEYTDWIDESMSWKETCYIGDWSFLWKRRFNGPDALKLFSDIEVNSFAKFDIGQAKQVIHCNDAGKVIHSGILSRFGEEDFMLFGTCLWAEYRRRKGRYDVTTERHDRFNFQVSGPNSLYVVEKAAGESIRDIGFMRFRTIHINGREVIALRQNMAGELGYELQGPAEYGREIYDAILEAGQEFGIRRLGGRVAQINHLEACFPTRGTDYMPAILGEDMKEYFEELKAALPGFEFAATFGVSGSFEADDVSAYYRSPVELGWAKIIKFDHDFIGRKALEAEVAHPKRTMVTLVWNADDVIDVYASLFRQGKPYHYMEMPRDQRGLMYADKVLKDGKLVGVSTSRGYSYYFRQMLSLCTIDIEFSKPDTEVTVVWGNPGEPQKRIRATVAPAPYKKDNRRIDVTSLSYQKQDRVR
jgi:vanillate/3-O-methylgallate O-demethylase